MTENDSYNLLKKILAKSEALEFKPNEKQNKVENIIRAEIHAIKRGFEAYKLLNYEEVKSIKEKCSWTWN